MLVRCDPLLPDPPSCRGNVSDEAEISVHGKSYWRKACGLPACAAERGVGGTILCGADLGSVQIIQQCCAWYQASFRQCSNVGPIPPSPERFLPKFKPETA